MATARSHFDYLTGLPLTRIATYVAKKDGYNIPSVNEGRLKSVILVHIYNRNQSRKNYVKHPYWEVRFKDSAGHKYSRYLKTDDDKAKARHQSKDEGNQALSKYQPSAIGNVKKERKHQAPGPLINLSEIGARLSNKYSINKINEIYEQMYNAKYVSYPRTADKKINQDIFNNLLSEVDKIADLVGVDKSLLTHRTLRKKYDGGKNLDHGANRPGEVVPSSLSEVKSQFGACGVDIYKLVARNYLSIMAEDAVYDKVTANLKDYPKFTTSFRVPVKANWKSIYKPNEKKQVTGTADMSWKDSPAKPFLYQGSNPKPSRPTIPWVLHYLQKMNVGTASTMNSTVGALAKGGKNQKLKQVRQYLDMTQGGNLSAIMALNTYIGDAHMTQVLHKDMEDVMNYKLSVHDLEVKASKMVAHDKAIMLKKGPELLKLAGKPKGKFKTKPKISNIKATPTDITCPKCKKGKVQTITLTRGNETYSFYGCSNRSCRFYSPLSFCGTKITPAVLQQIIKGTLPFKKYVSPRTHNPFPAKLYWSRGKIQLKFPPHKQQKPTKDLGIKCPKCHKGNLGLYEFTSKKGKHIKCYKCDNSKCKFFTFTSMAGFNFTPDRMKHIVKGDLPYQTLTSKRTGKTYPATFRYSRGKIKMKFKN